jgi:hypothetical protein
LLALVLTLIPTDFNYMIVLKELHKVNEGKTFVHSFWPWGVKLAVRNGMTAFGAATVIAVLWRGLIETVMVPALIATPMIFALRSIRAWLRQGRWSGRKEPYEQK